MTRRMPDGVCAPEVMAANVSAALKRAKTGKQFAERRTGSLAVNIAGPSKMSKEARAFAALLVRVRRGEEKAVKELEEKFHARIITWEKTMGFDADQHGKRVAPVSQCSAEELRWVRGVAQPGSAPRLGRGGRRFKSSHPDHFGRLYGGA